MKRVLTAIVALPILLYTVWSGTPYFFVGLTVIAALLALGEFYALASKLGCKPQPVAGYAAGLVVIASFLFEEPALAVAALVALAIIALASGVASPNEMSKSLVGVSVTAFGVIYISLLAGCLVGIRILPNGGGSKLLTMFFALVMMTDTGAFYTGRAIGRHKLAPRVSPGKTIEGAVGGFAAAVATGFACKLIFFKEIPLWHALLLGAAIGVVGQIGDLAESMLKRGSDVKDSGKLLPGHGGMLDRIDSILFSAPLLYYYSRLVASKF